MTNLTATNIMLKNLQDVLWECVEMPGAEVPSEHKMTELMAATVAKAYCHQYLHEETALDLFGPMLCDVLAMMRMKDIPINYLGPVRLDLFQAIELVENHDVDTVLAGLGALCEDAGMPLDALVLISIAAVQEALESLRREVN